LRDKIGHVHIAEKVNYQNCCGEIGRISEEVFFKVFFQGKLTHQISDKIDFPNLLWLKWSKSGFHVREFPHLMG